MSQQIIGGSLSSSLLEYDGSNGSDVEDNGNGNSNGDQCCIHCFTIRRIGLSLFGVFYCITKSN